MTKRSADVRVPPLPPRRAPMVTIELDRSDPPEETGAFSLAEGNPSGEHSLPFRPSRPPTPSGSMSVAVVAPEAPEDGASLPSSSKPPSNPGASPWAVPRPAGSTSANVAPRAVLDTPAAAALRLSRREVALPPASDEVPPPPLLSNDAASSRAEGYRESGLTGGPLTRHGLEFIGCRQEFLPRIAGVWRTLADAPSQPSATDQLRAAFEPPSAQPSLAHAKNWSLRVMARGTCSTASELRGLSRRSLQSHADADLPLCLLTGDLDLAFDELETLKATIAAAAAHLAEDDALAKAVALARPLVEDKTLQGSREVALAFAARIRAVCEESSLIDDGVVGQRVLRALVESRAYSRRTLFGAKWVRCTLARDGVATVAYIADSMASLLPLYATFPARIIGEIHPRQDHCEASAEAVCVVALGRLIEKGDE